MTQFQRIILLVLCIYPLLIKAQEDSITKKEQPALQPILYLRSGVAESKGGETMADFKAPGALAHYRLGNEANTYAEVGFTYHQKVNEADQSLDVVLMMSGYVGFGEKESFQLNNVAQIYAKYNHIIGGADVWAGKRYYFRQDYHMTDFFWYNPGQDAKFGFGVENIRSKNHQDKLAFALFNLENRDVAEIHRPNDKEEVKTSHLKTYSFEAKWSDIQTNKDGNIMIWARAAKRRANEELGFCSANGFGVGIVHQQSNLFQGKGTNNFQINFKKGVSVAQNQYTGLPVFENQGNAAHMSYNLKKNYAFEMSDSFFYEDEKNFAINALAVYRLEDRGITPYSIQENQSIAAGAKIHWASAGFRFMKYFHKHFNVAVEYGADYVNNQILDKEGVLQKVTLSPQISWNYGFYSRPVLRPFVTYAAWSKALKGEIGNGLAPFAEKTNGLTYGVAFEIWL